MSLRIPSTPNAGRALIKAPRPTCCANFRPGFGPHDKSNSHFLTGHFQFARLFPATHSVYNWPKVVGHYQRNDERALRLPTILSDERGIASCTADG